MPENLSLGPGGEETTIRDANNDIECKHLDLEEKKEVDPSEVPPGCLPCWNKSTEASQLSGYPTVKRLCND